jgi:hypothetical protein
MGEIHTSFQFRKEPTHSCNPAGRKTGLTS